ncbi:MAG: LuxR C-terminal-related transcriptional regulator [Aureliella sp.]
MSSAFGSVDTASMFDASGAFPSVSTFTGQREASLNREVVLVLRERGALAEELATVFHRVEQVTSPEEICVQRIGAAPSCLVLNADLHPTDLADQCGKVWQQAIGLPIVALTSEMNVIGVKRILQAGVYDCCERQSGLNELVRVLRKSLEHDAQGNPAACEVRGRIASLTEREREVVEECLQGTMTKVIAKHLDVTYQTIDKHRKKALRKMEAGSMVELASLLSHIASSPFGLHYEFRA